MVIFHSDVSLPEGTVHNMDLANIVKTNTVEHLMGSASQYRTKEIQWNEKNKCMYVILAPIVCIMIII
jgi:hypothetical protein